MRRVGIVVALALALVGAVAGCAADLTDAGLVDGLRLLGVQAEPPEAAPGDTVTLRAWTVDTRGGGVAVTWSACLLRSSGLANPGCLTGSDGRLALGSGDAISIVVPAVTPEMLGPADGTDGVYLPIVVHLSGAADALDGVYRLRIAGGLPANRNPRYDTIEGLSPDPLPTPTHAGQVWTLHPLFTDDSFEKYMIPSAGPEAHIETLTTEWFATAGTFADAVSGGRAYEGFKIDRALPPSGGVIDLWAVGHDERGGTAILHRTLVMQ